MMGKGNPFARCEFAYGKKTVSMIVHMTGCKTNMPQCLHKIGKERIYKSNDIAHQLASQVSFIDLLSQKTGRN